MDKFDYGLMGCCVALFLLFLYFGLDNEGFDECVKKYGTAEICLELTR